MLLSWTFFCCISVSVCYFYISFLFLYYFITFCYFSLCLSSKYYEEIYECFLTSFFFSIRVKLSARIFLQIETFVLRNCENNTITMSKLCYICVLLTIFVCYLCFYMVFLCFYFRSFVTLFFIFCFCFLSLHLQCSYGKEGCLPSLSVDDMTVQTEGRLNLWQSNFLFDAKEKISRHTYRAVGKYNEFSFHL